MQRDGGPMPKILAIDDKQDNLITLSAILKNLIPECNVITAQSGSEGLKKAKIHSPDTILLDIKMPGMDGYEVCKRLKEDENTQPIPVILISAVMNESKDLVKGLDSGADAYLTKPINELVLAAQIKTALRLKAAENYLRMQKGLMEDMLQAAMDNSQAGIAIADAPGGKLRYVNDAALLIRGKGKEEIVNGVGITEYVASWQIFHLDGTPYKEDEVPLARAVLYGETCSEEFIVRRADEVDRVVWANAAPIRDAQDEVVAGIVVFLDVTEKKQAEAEHEKLHAQLFQAQKMESVGRLAGGVAHDFNNKLTVILGRVQMLLQDMTPENPIYGDLEEIQEAAQGSADLTRQLLAFARKQTISPRKLDLNETVGGMLRMLGRLIGEDLDLAWHPHKGLWLVKMDPAQIDQILANLAVNARDAIDGVGKITIETKNAVLDDAYCAENLGSVPGEFVVLTVSDNGFGMDTVTLDQIFEPFFSTKEVGKGTGLGLSTVYGIVKQNDGFVSVYSEPGKGTTFKIYMPRYEGETSLETSNRSEEVLRGNGETILLVEDDPGILRITKMMLERLGYSLLTTSSPHEAMQLAREHTHRIHLLMTDVVMPRMNGKDLAEQVTKILPEIRTLFMSGYTVNVIARHGILDERVNFIEKPFMSDSLARKVRDVLDRTKI